MTKLLYTVDNLVSEVRSMLDETNVDSISTSDDILPSLNRAQDYAFDIYARTYPEPILGYSTLTLTGGTQEYSIPDTAFEDRVLKVEMLIGSNNGGTSSREVQRVSYRDLTNYESASQSNIPYYYAVVGRKIRFVPTPTGTYNARLWYLRNPEKLVLPQGRVTIVNTVGNYVIVDSAGSDLVTESDQLGSYVNVIDGQTGEVKTTLQIANINENKITFRSVPQRSSVLKRTVNGSFASTDISQDDYLSNIQGICVPYYGSPTTNFLIAYAVAELNRKLGDDNAREEEILKKFEQQVERTWVGREKQMRVQKRNQNFGVPTKRWYYE